MLAVIADDDRLTVALVSKTLQRWGVDVRIAHDGNAAWDLLGSMPVPSIAIVDWMMPGLDGIELCRRIRNTPSLAGIYVILLTARDSRPDLIAGLDAGSDDYMVKPIDSEELRARVQVGFRVAALQARLSQRVGQLKSARDHLARLASTDSLTGLHSRRWWFELAATEFSRSRRYRRPLTVMALDLDFFKRVNDTFGHDAGDRLLQEFADMLRFHCRQSDSIGRLGGEEFAVLVPDGATDAATHLAERIGEACRNLSVATPAGEVKCSCSIGISQVSPEDENIAAALRRADAAMYEAKRSGRDRWKCVDVLDRSA